MVHIPADIWIHVAQFIPSHHLRDMLDVNRTFFQLAMDERYRTIDFRLYYIDSAKLEEIRRLRHPTRARRVCKLYVDFNDINDYPPDDAPPVDEILKTITDVVTCLTNVTDFAIMWRNLEPGEVVLGFITAAWKSFGSNLQRIYFHVALTNFPALLSTSADSLLSLRTLCVDAGRYSTVQTGNENAGESALVTFISQVAPTLRSLEVSYTDCSTWTPSLLLRQLEHIPNLEKFRFWSDATMLSDPLSLTQFLRNHAATLRHIHFLVNGHKETYESMMVWLKENEGDHVLLSNLHTLHMEAPSTPAAFDLIAPYIRRSANTLTSLTLWNCLLSFEQVQDLVSFLPPHLWNLLIYMELLSPEIFLQLALALPNLHVLNILAFYVVSQMGTEDGRPTSIEEEQLMAASIEF